MDAVRPKTAFVAGACIADRRKGCGRGAEGIPAARHEREIVISNPIGHRNIALLMLAQAFLNTLFIIPVMVPYYRDVLGLNFDQFMVGEAVFSAVIILMEVPTGWISDVWTRRMTMALGALVYLIGWTLLWRADGYAAAVLARGATGAGASLISGTNSALLYESLMEAGQEGQFRRLEGLRQGIGLYASGIGALLGGFLYKWNRTAPVALTVLMSVIALGFVFLMREPARLREGSRRHPREDIVNTVRYVMHGHADLAGIILFAAVVLVTAKIIFWAQQPYYTLLHLPLPWFGILTATGLLLGGLGGHFGHKLEGNHNHVTVLTVCLIYLFAACLAGGLRQNATSLPLLLCCSLIPGVCAPKVQEALNQRAPPERRATVLSMASLITHILSVPMLAAAGWMTDRHGVRASLLGLAALLAIGGGSALTMYLSAFRGRS